MIPHPCMLRVRDSTDTTQTSQWLRRGGRQQQEVFFQGEAMLKDCDVYLVTVLFLLYCFFIIILISVGG